MECRTLLSTLTVTNASDGGPGSLRDAIAAANARSGADRIVFAPKVVGTISLTSGPLVITDNLDIDGPGANKLAVSGRGASRVFVIEGGSYGGAGRVAIGGLTVEHGLATNDLDFPASGGGILNLMAALTLDGCVIDSNQAPLSGAGTMIYRGSLAASGSTWSNNTVFADSTPSTVGSDNLGAGGLGITIFAGQATVDRCAFTTNTWTVPATSSSGGGILAEAGSTLTALHSHFDGNRVEADGGGIAAHESNVTVLDSSFRSNESRYTGGAIAVTASQSPTAATPRLVVDGGRFLDNRSGYSGGAIFVIGATADVDGSLFSANQVNGGPSLPSLAGGGAIGALSLSPFSPYQDIKLTVSRCIFVDNRATYPEVSGGVIAQGGAIMNQIAMTVTDSTFSGNAAESQAGRGGAIANEAGTAVTIARSTFVANQATGDLNDASGGAIYTNVQSFSVPPTPTTTVITACLFTNNTATGRSGDVMGGAIADGPPYSSSTGDLLDISDCRFSGNRVVGAPGNSYAALGGAVATHSRPLSISACSFLGNQAIGGDLPDRYAYPAGAAYGGAIEASGPSATIAHSRFEGNTARGGDSNYGGGNAGGGALSLGLYGTTEADVSGSTFVGNLAANGFGGVGFYPLAAAGGAILNYSHSLELSAVLVSRNQAFGGDSRPGSDANPATGGGIYNGIFAAMTMKNCTISGNLALGGQGGDASPDGGPAGLGGDASGGGIYNIGVLSLSGSTVTGNAAVGGAGGTALGGAGGRGGDAYGGGITAAESPYFPGSAAFQIDRCIVAGNQAIGGAGGAGATDGDDGRGLGGGIAVLGGFATIGKKTRVLGNLASTDGDNIYLAPPSP